ncbi:esterase-like activity of phytase family protein [Pannonibacter sp.]|uniref:esterase-like activity of phytase family protein n=1 Tax=Pannonibacter sp. TaxID=1906786 RepID=UPI003F724BE9
MTGRFRWAGLSAAGLGLALILSLATPSLAAGPLLADGTPVAVSAARIERFQQGSDATRFGKLTFLGGLDLTATNREIGGLSGLIILGDGAQMLAVTDNALWVAARIRQSPEGAPLGLGDVRYAPMLDAKGIELRKTSSSDTEAVTLGRNRGKLELFVATERTNRILRFAWPLTSAASRLISGVETPKGIRALRFNKGLEALAAAPDDGPLGGALVAIAERGQSQAHDLPGFILGGPRAGSFEIVRSDDYDATDAAFLPGGDLLLLERRFNLRDWVGMRLRRFAAADVKPGAVLAGEILMEAGPSHQIDNMEGLAVHQDAAGRTILTLLSDDNRSLLQRTLLLRFRLDG